MTRGGPPSWGLGEVLTTQHKNVSCYKLFTDKVSDLDLHSGITKQRKGDMRFGTWKIRGLYGAGSLTAATREWAKYKLDLVGVQEVRWDKGDMVRAGACIFYGRGNENHKLGTGLFVHHRIVSPVKRVKFVSYMVSYIVLRGHWCNFESTCTSEEKSDDSKDSFYGELEKVFIIFLSTI